MDILTLITQYPPHVTAGLGRYAEAITPRLLGSNRIWVLSINTGRLPPVVVEGPLRVYRPQGGLLRRIFSRRELNRTRTADFVLLAANVLISNLRFVSLTRRLVRHQTFDLVAVHESTNALGGLGCRAVLGVPMVFHVHNTEYSLAPERTGLDPLGAYRRLEALLAQRADAIVVATPELRDQLAEAGWRADKIHVVPLGNVLQDVVAALEESELAERAGSLRSRLGLSPSSRVVLFVGRVERVKGVEELLDAFPAVLAEHPDAVLVLLGRGDTDRATRRSRATGCADRVIVTDTWVEPAELPGWYAMAEVCVFPSHFEPFGLVALESMSLGRPTILGEGFSTLFEGDPARPAVRFVDATDPAQIAAAVSAVLTQPDEASELGDRARTLVRERFSWERAARDTERIYRGVVAASRPVDRVGPRRWKRAP